MRRLIFLLILLNFTFKIQCFNVKFNENYDAVIHDFDTHIFKRELTQFFDKASYSFDGLSKIESVPVLFPLDICIINLEGIKYATALHKHKDGTRHFAIFRHTHTQTPNYQQLLDVPTPKAIALDCTTHAGRGYVALAYNQTETIERAREGSPIYVISTAEGVRAVQYFAATNLRAMYLRVSGNELTLLQTFESSRAIPNLNCPFFKWSGTSFNRVGRIPCSNARRLEPFTIDYEHYVAVANYADEHGRTDVNSEIYKYNLTLGRFMLFQRIRTNGAVDVKYFSVPQDEVRRNHFLIFGNSVATKPNGRSVRNTADNLEADSIFYVYDKGQFVPYQSLAFYAVERFLPVQHEDHEKFLLLVASNKQDIKIFNLNDWKFEESKVQFTEGALSRGVARMRTYVENGQTFLVIANELMADNETNIFLPIYKQDEHANVLRQQIIEWASRENERLATIDVFKLQQAVEEKLAKLGPQQQQATTSVLDNGHIKRVETKSFVSPHLNLHRNYWQALSYAKRALDVMEHELYGQRKQQRVSRSLKSQTLFEQHEFVEINVDTLIVRDKLQAERINGIDSAEPKFEQVNATKVYVERNFKAPSSARNASAKDDVLNVEHLEIEGTLNGQTWQSLVNDTLKRSGMQFIKSPAIISNLEAETVVVTSDLVNGESLGQLILTTGGDYIIQQDVQFAAPIQAKELLINERLNHIHVYKQQFDVLLKRANWTQIIEGTKRFEKLKVLSAITVAGQLQGERLRAMSPMQAIHQNLHLHGDYIINGVVTIEKFLSAMDINEENQQSKRSLTDMLLNGIRVTEPLENVNLIFQQPINANNTHLSFVNAQDMQDLIKLNHNEVQIVEGNKIFRRNLIVRHGFTEVKQLNGNDIEQLPSKLLLKHSNQTIAVPMHVGKIIGRGVQAAQIKLNSYNLTDYLTQTGVQRIKGTLHVQKLNVATLNVSNLNANGDLFGHNLSDIYQHKSLNAPNAALLFREGQKFHGSIYVQNLWLKSTLNNVSVADLERALQQLDGNIKYVGDFKFKNEMHFKGLSFEHSLNGITAEDFGRNWLQRAGEQDFTAPQTLANIVCKQDLKLLGKLNGQTLKSLQLNTYRLDRDEQLEAVRFENPIEVSGTLHSTHINGLQIPADVLQHSSVTAPLQPQTLYTPLVVHGNLSVKTGIHNASIVNSYNLWSLGNYLYGDGYETLYVENAEFTEAPNYKTLNKYNLQEMLDHVWLANENVELMMAPNILEQQQQLELATAHFDGLLDFEGAVNNVDLAYMKHNYFSLTREQQIVTALRFVSDVTLTQQSLQQQQQINGLQTLEAEEIQLEGGALVESGSNAAFNFNEFVAKTLKTAGAHHITGEWHIPAATVNGPLENVRINDMNLAKDVLIVNNSTNAPTIIHAEKRINNAAIKKLHTTMESFVANVPVLRWINDAVYIYGNHTIQGTTTLESVNLYNDLSVDGLVNGQRVDATNLLLRDGAQYIKGDLVVHNSLPAAKRILPHNIEQLSAKHINGLTVHEFLDNQAHNHPNLHIESHLIFEQPLTVNNYQVGTGESTDAGFKWKRSLNKPEGVDNAIVSKDQLQPSRKAKLSHFELRQHLPLAVHAIVPLSLQLDQERLDVIAVRQDAHSTGLLEFYVWQKSRNMFVHNSTLNNWLPQEEHLLDYLQLVLKRNGYIKLSKENTSPETIVNAGMPSLIATLTDKHKQNAELTHMQLGGEDCLGINDARIAEFTIYCLSVNGLDDFRIYKAVHINRVGIKQVLAIGRDMIAILYDNGTLEFWSYKAVLDLKLLQEMHIPRAKQMAKGERNGHFYLAIVCGQRPHSLAKGSVEIYSNAEFGANKFELLQTLDVQAPLQVAFTALNAADDLLLYVLTDGTQPLLVYQYQGVMGFQQIVQATILPKAHNMTTLTAAGKHFLALMAPEAVYFVETVLVTL